MSRPASVVNAWQVPAQTAPRFTPPQPGIGALVRKLGDAAGLGAIGVSLREITPGNAGTNRHFHTVEEEWAYVISGRGVVRIGPHRLAVVAGDFVAFPPGPRPHHFLAEGDVPLVLLEGGERRRAEDGGRYVDLQLAWDGGRLFATTEPPPPEEGEAEQLVRPHDVPEVAFQHPVDPQAFRRMRPLSAGTELRRQAFAVARIEAGSHSTALHTHDRTDEWVFVLAGRARVRVGDTSFEVGPHDFVAHPANGAPHCMVALAPTTYAVGGQRDANDVVLYPEAGVQLVRGQLVPLGA